ncbi:MAG: phenylalanine--tRNA ligase subunit beta [Acidobacteriia bacterium]|nr:phenylalanine--tRNA ligase subunit beta [Terriglobia bacterium]
MRILLSWLRDFVEIEESPRELADALTMAGMAVDAVESEAGETVFEFDITSNRPDAMNHFGMAREVAAIYRRPLRAPSTACAESGPPAASMASVAIQDPDACVRYVGRVFTAVEVRPSPDWMRRRLELCGVRSINNLADLTNYVLLEIGQPTHAFDLDRLAGAAIVVRRARHGERLVTLDGEDRDLTEGHLAICDAERPVALAGVMGGQATEITAETRNVLLEAAWFRPSVIRNAARGFKLFTEASHRFERGADWNAAPRAADRIATLLAQTGPGQVLPGQVDCFPRQPKLSPIRLERAHILRHLGIQVDDAEVEEILSALGFEPSPDTSGWSVPAASHRLDVERGIDLIEEVARIHGFANIPATLPLVGAAPEPTPLAAEDARMRSAVRGLGYDETIGFAFISSDEAERFGPGDPVSLRNPLSQLWDVMRNSAVPTMVRALEWNLRRNQPFVRLAEFGRIYQRSGASYDEPSVLTLGASGTARQASWAEPAREVGFYDIKADIAVLLAPFFPDAPDIVTEGVPPYYRDKHAVGLKSDGEVLAWFGELDPKLARERKIRQPVWVAEIFLDKVYGRGLRRPIHGKLAKVPAVSRDFSLLVPNAVDFASITEAVGEMPDLDSVEPVEVFRGKNVPEGSYSLLLRAWWQRLDESLTDEEVNGFAAELRSRLQSRLGITTRT